MVAYEGGDAIYWPGGRSCFPEGQPDLPAMARTFVIPQGASAVEASIEVISETGVDGMYDILPVRSVPLGSDPGPFLRDPGVYMGGVSFPASNVV